MKHGWAPMPLWKIVTGRGWQDSPLCSISYLALFSQISKWRRCDYVLPSNGTSVSFETFFKGSRALFTFYTASFSGGIFLCRVGKIKLLDGLSLDFGAVFFFFFLILTWGYVVLLILEREEEKERDWEREREREREGNMWEKHRLAALYTLQPGIKSKPRHVSWLGIKPAAF